MNIAGNQVIGTVSSVSAALEIGGLLVFAAIVLDASGISLETSMVPPSGDPSLGNFLGGVALAIPFKGFTTTTSTGLGPLHRMRIVFAGATSRLA